MEARVRVLESVHKPADVFEVGPVRRERMLFGDFLLGLDLPRPIYEEDREELGELLEDREDRLLEITIAACADARSATAGFDFGRSTSRGR